MRQVILDTETTGLDPSDGHRVIEIGCIEMVNGDSPIVLHAYINQSEKSAGSHEVHGITNEFLKDKANFAGGAKNLLSSLVEQS